MVDGRDRHDPHSCGPRRHGDSPCPDLTEIADAGHIVENGSTMLYRLDPTHPYKIKYVSRNIDRYGYTQSQLLSTPGSFVELVHPDDHLSHSCQYRRNR